MADEMKYPIIDGLTADCPAMAALMADGEIALFFLDGDKLSTYAAGKLHEMDLVTFGVMLSGAKRLTIFFDHTKEKYKDQIFKSFSLDRCSLWLGFYQSMAFEDWCITISDHPLYNSDIKDSHYETTVIRLFGGNSPLRRI